MLLIKQLLILEWHFFKNFLKKKLVMSVKVSPLVEIICLNQELHRAYGERLRIDTHSNEKKKNLTWVACVNKDVEK